MNIPQHQVLRSFPQAAAAASLLFFLLTTVGCQRLGKEVAEILPKRGEKAPAQIESEGGSEGEEMYAGDAAGTADDSRGSDAEEPGGADFPGAEDSVGDDGVGGNFGDGSLTVDDDPSEGLEPADTSGLENDPLTGTAPSDDPAGDLIGNYGNATADPATSPQGDPGTATAGGTGQPAQRQGKGQRKGKGKRQGNGSGKKKPSFAGSSSPQPRKGAAAAPAGRPFMRLIANATGVPLTSVGQRVSFSVDYQLERDGLSPNGVYRLVIESDEAGQYRFGPIKLGEEGTINTPGIAIFRPGAGPFRAYLAQDTKQGPRTISNKVQFKTQR